MSKHTAAAINILSHISSEHYRLMELSQNRFGDQVFDDEINDAIRELGNSIQLLDDLLNDYDYKEASYREYEGYLDET